MHFGDLGLSTAEDAAILQAGLGANRTVVTLEADFHALLAMSGAIAPSVIRIRIEGLRGEALTELLLAVIAQCASDIERGAAVTVQSGRIRIRHLPLLDG